MLPSRVSYVEIIDLDSLDFDLIFGIDWLYACFSSIDCRTRMVSLTFQMSPFFRQRGETLFLEVVSSLV